jgi:hypothetical protein
MMGASQNFLRTRRNIQISLTVSMRVFYRVLRGEGKRTREVRTGNYNA